MATPVRRQFSALIRDLAGDASRFEFFQAVRLLESSSVAPRRTDDRLQGAVRLRTAPELSFPAADLRRAYLDDDGVMVLEAGFLGLYGVDAPLPTYFWESVARGEESGQCLRAFLDLFGSRLYELLYLAWKKTRAHLCETGDFNLLEAYLHALSGAPRAERRDLAMAYAGEYGRRVKGAAALAGILGEQLGVPAQVEEFVPCWVDVGSVSAVGQKGMALGDDLVLGARVLDIGRKINLLLGPLSETRALELLPGRPGAKEIKNLVDGYLEPTLEFDVIFLVEAAVDVRRLGGDPIQLGWTSCLGEPGLKPRRIRLAGSAYEG